MTGTWKAGCKACCGGACLAALVCLACPAATAQDAPTAGTRQLSCRLRWPTVTRHCRPKPAISRSRLPGSTRRSRKWRNRLTS